MLRDIVKRRRAGQEFASGAAQHQRGGVATAGAQVHWFIDDRDVGASETYTVDRATANYTVQCKLIGANGAVLAESGVETVKVNTGFFAKLIIFFRGIFGTLPVITQAIRHTL